MTTKDEKLGEELAELARQFLLWLENNELPGVPGLRGARHDFFKLYAGTYHKLDRVNGNLFDNRLLPNLWADQPDELRRMQGLRLGISHVLLVGNPNEDITLADGRIVGSNRIVLAELPKVQYGQQPPRVLDRAGALITVKPRLDSRSADEVTLSRVHNYDFSSILNRVDLVFDDTQAGAQARFQYPYLLDYTPPRRMFDNNVQDVEVPQQIEPPAGPMHDRLLAQRVKEFREHLYHNATYHNRRRVAERGGDYFPKYRNKNPLDAKYRQFRPTMLSDDYLKECFKEFVMKKGDDLLLLDLPDSRHLYRLFWEVRPGAVTPPKFTVQPLLTIGGAGPRKPKKDPDDPETVEFPVTAVIFRALDGADELPTQLGFGKLDYRGGLPESFVVDYKAFLRWYYNDLNLRYRDDKEWLDTFVDVFFGDQSYPIELNVLPVLVPNREQLFLGALRAEFDQLGAGPIKDRFKELIDWCDDKDRKDRRFVFTQGMMVNGRQLIGVSPRGDVFEWHPETEHVTATKLEKWLGRVALENLSADVYANTAGMLPFITLITWGGVIVMTGGIVGVPATMTTVARTVVTQLATKVAGSAIAKNAAVAARGILIAELVSAAMSLIPKNDNLLYQFIHGVFEGFGGGAVEHYLSETDERVKRLAAQIPRLAANYVTKNGYQAYLVYDKVKTALVKISGVIRALRVVLVDARAKLVAQQLARLSQYAGTGFLIVLFVVVYLDWVYRSRPGVEIDKWVNKQKQTLKWMVENTGNEIADYAKELRQDLASVSDYKSPAATAAVRKHDQKLTATITGKLRDGVNTVPAVAEFLQMLFERMGIKDWHELQKMGLTDVMARGVAALPTGAFAADQARKLGAAFGELVGTIMLERRIVPDDVKANTGFVFDKRQSHRAAKTALAGGTWRALWQFAIHPFENLGDVPESLKRGLEDQGGLKDPKDPKLMRVAHRDTAFRDFVQSLIGNEEELTRRLAKLAADSGLEANVRRLISSAVANLDPPSLGDLTRKDNPDWPTDAVMFLLYTWLRIGIRQFGEMFDLIQDDVPYGKLFKLSDLLDIVGLDVPLDDATLASLKATFLRKS